MAAQPAATAAFDQTLHEALPQALRNRGTLRVATDASYAPAEFFAEDGRTIVGFDPDLAKALGQVLGLEVELVNAYFQTLMDLTVSGGTDVVMSAITDTPEREKQLDFVHYFMAGTSIVVQRGNPAAIGDLRDLCGQAVAGKTGTIQVEQLERAQSNCGADPIVLVLSDTSNDAELQLRTGQVAAVLMDYPTAALLTSAAETRGSYQLASDAQYEPGPLRDRGLQERA